MLHWPSVAWGLAHISSHEISQWIAEYSIEPFGEVRNDLQSGIIAATVANVNRDSDKKRDAYEATDFMPTFETEESEPKGMKPEDTLMLMQFWFPRQEGGDPSAQ